MIHQRLGSHVEQVKDIHEHRIRVENKYELSEKNEMICTREKIRGEIDSIEKERGSWLSVSSRSYDKIPTDKIRTGQSRDQRKILTDKTPTDLK